ncbi:hypothetical protein N7I30_13730 [Aurantimonas litoralis]|nr:hypothetical protein [Aurantimonas litoralis]
MTTEAKHTPGPWLIREGFSTDTLEVYPRRDGKPEIGSWAELATVRSDYGNGDGDTAEGEANARLIAAAPDLLAALESLTANLDEGDFISLTRIDAAKAAIAKARS